MGDIRLDSRRNVIVERVAKTGSLVQRKVGGGRNGEVAMLNFLASPRVTIGDILAADVALTAAAARGRRIVVPQDTTEVNFSGRDKRRKGLGPAGDGKTPGFLIHAAIAVDAADEAVIGPVSAQIWTREAGETVDYTKRVFEDKESARWLKGAQSAEEVLDGAEEIVVAGDRESDIYPLFAHSYAVGGGSVDRNEGLAAIASYHADKPGRLSRHFQTGSLGSIKPSAAPSAICAAFIGPV
jgi:hypothetical protein